MDAAVVFSNASVLDELRTRYSVLRIPEVTRRLNWAQRVIESKLQSSFDLCAYLSSDNAHFFRQPAARALAVAVVQCGLYDRYTKIFSQPKFLVGNCRGDAALLVASGVVGFEEMVFKSFCFEENLLGMALVNEDGTPILAGQALAEHALFMEVDSDNGTNRYMRVEETSCGLDSILSYLSYDLGLRQIVNIGPGKSEVDSHVAFDMGLQQVDSIELDPMLRWFDVHDHVQHVAI